MSYHDLTEAIQRLEQHQMSILAAISRMEERLCHGRSAGEGGQQTTAMGYERFQSSIPHPNLGRDSRKSSFVNVAASLKAGIESYNASIGGRQHKIDSTELNGSLIAWSNHSMAAVRSVVGRFKDLNEALGTSSLDGIKKIAKYQKSPGRYNRDVSGVIRDIKKVLPILVIAKGDWAARELLRNTFQNSYAATKKRNSRKLASATPSRDRDLVREEQASDGRENNLHLDADERANNASRAEPSRTTLSQTQRLAIRDKYMQSSLAATHGPGAPVQVSNSDAHRSEQKNIRAGESRNRRLGIRKRANKHHRLNDESGNRASTGRNSSGGRVLRIESVPRDQRSSAMGDGDTLNNSLGMQRNDQNEYNEPWQMSYGSSEEEHGYGNASNTENE